MHFNGAHSRSRESVGVAFISPNGKSFPYSFCFDFDSIKNLANNYSFLLGLKWEKDIRIQELIQWWLRYSFSKCRGYCIMHPRKVFYRWRSFWISIKTLISFFLGSWMQIIGACECKLLELHYICISHRSPKQHVKEFRNCRHKVQNEAREDETARN